MRCVRTRVLPEPAPARISSGEPACVTASRWRSLRPRVSDSGFTPGREGRSQPDEKPAEDAGGSHTDGAPDAPPGTAISGHASEPKASSTSKAGTSGGT